MAQTVSPGYLLQVPAGWSQVGKGVVRRIDPADLSHIQLDGYEWFDVNGLGVGGTQVNIQTALQRFRQQVQNLGSDLYAYALIKKTEFNFNVLGVQLGRVDRYRLVLCHSQAQVIFWFAVVLGGLVSALILFQYATTGQSMAADQLGHFWGGIMQDAGNAVGTAGSGITKPFLIVAFAAGGLLLLYGLAAKELGVSGSPPKANIGVRSKHTSVGVGA